MIRALVVAVAAAAATLALARPAAAEPAPLEPPGAPCGSDVCTYQQLSDEDGSDDEGQAIIVDGPMGPTAIANISVCGDVDTWIPFVDQICVPVW